MSNSGDRDTILYLTYDGVLEALGESQVVQYLKKLSSSYSYFLVSYEKQELMNDKEKLASKRLELREHGIYWLPLKYHKRLSFLATSYDIIIGLIVSIYVAMKYKPQIIHARSYVPSIIALFLKKALGLKFIFDMRGFWPEEKVDSGSWRKSSYLYSLSKSFEGSFLRNADRIVVLTDKAKRMLMGEGYPDIEETKISVIPTCVNMEIFRPSRGLRKRHEIKFGYSGTTTRWYDFDKVAGFFKVFLDACNNASLKVITKDEHSAVEKIFQDKGIPLDKVEVVESSYFDMADALSDVTFGVFFAKSMYSVNAASPTKLAEFLACGIPCITNSGLGDSDSIIENESVGFVLKELSKGEFESFCKNIPIFLRGYDEMRKKCVEVAKREFSLERGVGKYSEIYMSLFDEAKNASGGAENC